MARYTEKAHQKEIYQIVNNINIEKRQVFKKFTPSMID